MLRRRMGLHTFGPIDFRSLRDLRLDLDNVEGFEVEQKNIVGMLSTPSSRKNSLVAISQRGRRGQVSSGSGSGSQSGSGSGSGSGGSRAVSAAYSVSVSGTGSGSRSGSGGSVR